MEQRDVEILMQQIWFFNQQFHESEDQEQQVDFHELMRASKNRCQLMLLKFASPEHIWIRQDLNSPNQEWSLGLYGDPESHACHIPLHVLQQGLSKQELMAWNIQ